MKRMIKAFLVTTFGILTIARCAAGNKTVELPEIMEIQAVQYNSVKIPVERLESEKVASLVEHLEALQPAKDNDMEADGIFDTITLIYENGDKDVFLFWEAYNEWYAETLDGKIYTNTGFVQNYINRSATESRPAAVVPDLFWIHFLKEYNNNDDYDIFPELINCLTQGYPLNQAAEMTENKIRRDEMLYQYAVSHNFTPTNEELQNYMLEITNELKTMSDDSDLETAFTELGTTIENEIDKRSQNIRRDLSIQMLYHNRYDAFRCGEDTIEGTVYWDFETYWNAFIEENVLKQQLSDETEADMELQMTRLLEYVISNKESLEEKLEVTITL